MAKTDRVQNVKTPGVEQTQEDGAAERAGTAAELSTEDPAKPAVAPDLQAMIDAAVKVGVAQALAQRSPTAAPAKPVPLPTQEEALKTVMADPKRRSVLSVDGWVTATPPQPAGFAKA